MVCPSLNAAPGSPPGGGIGLVWPCCMRLFRLALSAPSVRHLFAHFYSSRGVRPRRELHHDRFGSRRSSLRHDGAWPGPGAGGGQGLQTRRSRRFRDQAGGPDQERGGAGRQDPARRCGPMRIPPSGGPISAPACRSSARSPPRRRRTAPTGSGWPRPSSRSAPPARASRPSCSSAPRPRPTSPISAPATPPRRPMRWPCSAGRCPTASSGGRRWMRSGCRSTCARSPRCAASTRRCATSTVSAVGLYRRLRRRVAAGLLPVL